MYEEYWDELPKWGCREKGMSINEFRNKLEPSVNRNKAASILDEWHKLGLVRRRPSGKGWHYWRRSELV